ncbi:ACP S-malonyltransferase [Caproiciproducens galactitolivorans]|uniref:Malonyl CoA-acyl carrier protein transacylase n=1 Tax=Caproiciproducens galactitolivorans TaxID=642589 RepID=A0ABT4BWJ2_9FIRM|nr:ACP S-malonyltransferase [Caproiciproducens galactitolivorans]MCY1715266.1 ACP S-malonyltransferase [Caproiciproducens galactitolivorans]
MGKIAFVFSGQGTQYSGMGKDLYENSPAAKEVFDTADSIRPGTSGQCFTGTLEELSQTINTQPCVFCVDLAAARCLQELGIQPEAVAGFSLGEVAALTFAGAFSAEEGFRFVCKRAEFMQDAAEKSRSAMAAVLKLSVEQVRSLCEGFKNAYPVNYNCKGQTVAALPKSELDEFCEAVQKTGGRAVPLQVSGGFHSPFMDEASEKLLSELQNIDVKQPELPVYSNVDAKPYGEDRKKTIARQVNSPVYWQKSVENMIADGFDTFVEVGPGKTLTGLIRKISPQVRVFHVENFSDAQNAAEEIRRQPC